MDDRKFLKSIRYTKCILAICCIELPTFLDAVMCSVGNKKTENNNNCRYQISNNIILLTLKQCLKKILVVRLGS